MGPSFNSVPDASLYYQTLIRHRSVFGGNFAVRRTTPARGRNRYEPARQKALGLRPTRPARIAEGKKRAVGAQPDRRVRPGTPRSREIETVAGSGPRNAHSAAKPRPDRFAADN